MITSKKINSNSFNIIKYLAMSFKFLLKYWFPLVSFFPSQFICWKVSHSLGFADCILVVSFNMSFCPQISCKVVVGLGVFKWKFMLIPKDITGPCMKLFTIRLAFIPQFSSASILKNYKEEINL